MNAEKDTTFYVADWLVRPQLNRIERNGEVRRLEPKVMEVLCLLASEPGRVAARESILETVWANTIVTDDVLTRCISEIRKAFGDTSREQLIVETIPKTGYRLVAHVAGAGVDRDSHADTGARRRASDVAKWVVFCLMVFGFSFVMWLSLRPPPPPFAVAARPVSTAVGNELEPDLSPDGATVSYAWAGESGDNWDIYARGYDGSTPARLTESSEHERSPSFSPDGNLVAFIRYSPDGCEVARVTVVSREVSRVGDCVGNVYPDLTWSPSGDLLAFSGREPGDDAFGIYVLSLADGSTRRVTNPPPSVWGDHDPSFSSDGRTLAFTRSASEGIQDLYLLDVRSGIERRLTADARNILGHDWLPKDDDLLVATNRGGGYALWRFPINGSQPTRVFSVGSIIAKPTVSENGHVVVEQSQSDVNIWIAANRARMGRENATSQPQGAAPLAGDELVPRKLEGSTRWDMHPALSPDGTSIAYTSNRTGSYEVWAGPRDGAATQRTFFDGPFTGTPRWSPDGNTIAFDGRPDGTSDIFLIDAAGGVPRRLTTHPANDIAPAFSRDGKWVFFASTRTGTWEVWKLRIVRSRVADGASSSVSTDQANGESDPGGAEDATAIQVTTGGGFASREAIDGGGIFFTRAGAPGLGYRDHATGAVSSLPVTLNAEDWASWDVATDGIYYIRRGASTEIVRFDPASGSSNTVITIPGPVPHSDAAFSTSYNGEWLAWGQIDRQEVDLLAVGSP